MIKLIRADLYKTFHRAYFYVMLLCLAGLAVVINLYLFRPAGSSVSTSWTMVIGYLLPYPAFLMPMLVDIVTAEEIKEHTMKNTLSFGTGRVQLYISKVITSILLGILLGAVAIGLYCGSSALFLAHDAAFTDTMIRDFFGRVAAACTVYLAGIAASTFFAILLKRNSLYIFAYLLFLFLPQYLLRICRVPQFIDYMLIPQFNLLAAATPNLWFTVAVSLIIALILTDRKRFGR